MRASFLVLVSLPSFSNYVDAWVPSSQIRSTISVVVASPPSSSSTALPFGDFFNFDKGDEGKNKESAEEEDEKSKAPDEDPIEKIFGFFFGGKEDNPMGMDRFGPERFPEQYPAVLDEWADPVGSDTAEMAKLRPLMKNTNLETRGLKLSYDANRDGWDAIKFHQAVDKKGGAICFVLKTCPCTMGA